MVDRMLLHGVVSTSELAQLGSNLISPCQGFDVKDAVDGCGSPLLRPYLGGLLLM